MPSLASDRALRRLVADLSRAAPEDIEAILTELAPDQRQMVEALLDAYVRLSEDASQTLSGEVLVIEGLSPWMNERLTPAQNPMTPTAQAALRTASQTLLETGRLRRVLPSALSAKAIATPWWSFGPARRTIR